MVPMPHTVEQLGRSLPLLGDVIACAINHVGAEIEGSLWVLVSNSVNNTFAGITGVETNLYVRRLFQVNATQKKNEFWETLCHEGKEQQIKH